MATKTLFILEFLALLSGVIGQEAVSYFGKEIGDFAQPSTPSYGVQGSVYAINDGKLWLRGFSYDGNAPDAFFWAGSSANPDQTGTLIPDETGRIATLRAYNNENIVLSLSPGGNISELKWISVWSKTNGESLAHVNVPSAFVPPTTRSLGRLALSPLVHSTQADSVEIINTQTVKFYNLQYDGKGPGAYFWVGPGSTPSTSGSRIPDETGRIKVLRKYNGEDITVRFDGDRTVFGYDHIGLWCEIARQNFGHVGIPDRNQLNVPPSLETMEMPNDFENCQDLDDRLQVSWTIRGDFIDIQLSGRVNMNDYMAFGISGSDTATLMKGADVTVAWFDGSVGQAKDYKLTEYAQCSGGNGACPDTEVGAVNDVTEISAFIFNGVTSVLYTRRLDTGDTVGDKIISTSGATQIVWAIGQINADGLAVRHIERGGMELSFGRTPSMSCTSLGDVDAVDGWKELRLIGSEDTTEFTAVIGQSGGERGYTSITDNVGWGIAWYINDMLVPRIFLKRNVTYTFKVLGGNDATQSASYHPFYLTNDKGGGYASLSDMERTGHVIYAGPVNGSLCELNDKSTDKSKTSKSAEDYRNTLEETCASPKEPATLTWTPDKTTPDIVYYQCYTHRFLGWQIEVVDELPPPSSASIMAPTGFFKLFIVSFSIVIGQLVNRY